jgi:indole-3-glycerol phosphate synthase
MESMTILDRIVEDKKEEVIAAARRVAEADLRRRIDDQDWAARGFEQCLRTPGPGGVNVIAEVKRASPSKGDICGDLDAAACARQYQAGGAAAVSVLTDGAYFKGSLEDLRQVRRTVSLPVLRKEFIISDYQLYQSREAGADAVLLIVRILSPAQLQEMLSLSRSLGMDALVEIYSPDDYAVAHAAGARLIGINNRNLATFDTSLQTALSMKSLLRHGEVAVAASGIAGRADIENNLAAGIFNFLIGESLVRARDRAAFLKTLIHAHDGVTEGKILG